MIACPNCTHQNPDDAQVCEACYTPLPTLTACPNCGAAVQTDATFCGQCGFGLKPAMTQASGEFPAPDLTPSPLSTPDPEAAPQPLAETETSAAAPELTPQENEPVPAPPQPPVPVNLPPQRPDQTQLQQQVASLLHLQTGQKIELPHHLDIIHIGKPNDRIPPDIDVSGFPNSDVVSRIHADLRVEGDVYYIEDSGSANGTYVNQKPLLPGNRHRLRTGDRISLGKNDLVSFLFQMA